MPHFNVVNGGAHASNDLDFQEFMIAPLGAPSMAEAVRAGAEVYAALRRELARRKLSTGLGDEGGFAPEMSEPEEVLRLLVTGHRRRRIHGRAPTACPSRSTPPPRSSGSPTAGTGWPANCSTARR